MEAYYLMQFKLGDFLSAPQNIMFVANFVWKTNSGAVLQDMTKIFYVASLVSFSLCF